MPTIDTWDIASWYPREMIVDELPTRPTMIDWNAVWEKPMFKVKSFNKPFLLTKCMNCEHCFKCGDGEYICKCSIHGGKPERETCNYERKKR